MSSEALATTGGTYAARSGTKLRPLQVMRTGRPDLRVAIVELWQYRDVLWFLTWRDIKVRYKQTILGVGWAIVQPLLTMLVFTLFLGSLSGVPSDGLPYPIFVFCALLPWQLFAHALAESGNSLVANQHLITKVYFPRLFLPIAPVLRRPGRLRARAGDPLRDDALVSSRPGPGLAVLLPLTAFAVITALAVGIWLAAANLQYRDVRYLLPFLGQIWFFATPVAYSSSLVPPAWQAWYGLNPMVGVIEGFRWALLGTEGGSISSILVSALVVAVLLIGGLRYFHVSERRFADHA